MHPCKPLRPAAVEWVFRAGSARAFVLACVAMCAFTSQSGAATSVACPLPLAGDVAVVDWPADSGWSRIALASFAGQTFDYTTNLPGYANRVNVRRLTPTEFELGPTTMQISHDFSAVAGPLSGRAIDYMSYRLNGEVSYTFDVPLDHNDGIVLLDVDYAEEVMLSIFDSGGAPLPLAGWSVELVRSVMASDDDPNPNGVVSISGNVFTLVGSDDPEADPVWLLRPDPGQSVGRIVLNGDPVPGANGTWEIAFAHGGCLLAALDDDFTVTPLPTDTGGSTASVLSNDSFNGVPVSESASSLELIDTDGLSGLTFGLDGTFTLPPGLPAGTYVVIYRICATQVPGLCDTARAMLRLAPVAPVPLLPRWGWWLLAIALIACAHWPTHRGSVRVR